MTKLQIVRYVAIGVAVAVLVSLFATNGLQVALLGVCAGVYKFADRLFV